MSEHGWLADDADLFDGRALEDLLDEATYTWHGAWNYVRLEPAQRMAHIFVIRHAGNRHP